MIDLKKYTTFGKVSDIYPISDKDGLNEFLYNVVLNDNMFDENNNNGYGNMLKDLSNIYILLANNRFPFNRLTLDNKKNLKISDSNSVLGYIWVDSPPQRSVQHLNVEIHYIKYIDSRISKLNIASYMINCYENQIQENEWYKNKIEKYVNLLPYEIEYSARLFWKKYFKRVYELYTKCQYEEMIQKYGIQQNIKWDILLHLL